MITSNYFTPEGLAELYQVPKTTIWKWIRQGDFKGALRIGKHIRIPDQARYEFERKHQTSGRQTVAQ